MNNDQYLKELGSKIRKARLARGISIQMLSHLCMADRSNLVAIERGKKNVKVLTLRMIADNLDMSLKDLF